MASYKINRISSDITKYLSEILANETRDELFKTVTITTSRVTNDLSYCKVYFTTLYEDYKVVEKQLNSASSFIRGKLSEKIDIRHTPVLQFIYDESIDPIIIQQGEFDSVIVTAWDGHQRDKRNDPSINKHCADSIIKYLSLLCDRCRIKQIILCGSVKEYGNISGIITEETETNINDLTAYGRSKIKLYHDLLSSGICDNITELRFHSVYGYVHRCDQMIGNMLKTVHNGNEFVFSSLL